MDEALKARIKHFITMLNGPDIEPSPSCTDGEEHQFQGTFHADSSTHYSWIFECSKCKEQIKQTSERSDEDKEYWD